MPHPIPPIHSDHSYKNTLIIEGGAMRSVFSAGLLDGFLEKNFNPFDAYLGVSAGACNLVNYLAGKRGRSLNIFLEVSKRPEFINLRRFLMGGHLLDMDWLFEQVIQHEIAPSALLARGNKPLLICATDVATGEAIYMEAQSDQLLNSLKASMALPLIYRSFPLVQQRAMVDGGVSDAIPIHEAIRRGAQRIMVVRSRPRSYVKQDSLGHRYIRWKMRHYPHLVQTMKKRVQKHADITKLLASPPEGVEIMDVCPPDEYRMGRFGSQQKQLLYGYHAGLAEAERSIAQWQSSKMSGW